LFGLQANHKVMYLAS